MKGKKLFSKCFIVLFPVTFESIRGICQIKVEYIHSGSQQKLRSKNWQILKFRSDNQLLKALTNLIILLYDLHFVLNFEVFQLPQHNVHFAKNLTCDNL